MDIKAQRTKKDKYRKMLKSGRPVCNAYGEIVKDAEFQSTKTQLSRIHPNRRYFVATRSVSQNELDEFRNASRIESPYNVLLSTGKVPYSLLEDNGKKIKKLEFGDVFGSKATRKKPKLQYSSLEELAQQAETNESHKEVHIREYVKGQSQRIWQELYKVLDSSDVVVHVLDARDPLGTACEKIERYVKEEAPHKHLIYVLNKVDLVPTSVTARWLRILAKKHSTVAYHSNSLNNCYGKNNLINLLKQLAKLYKKPKLSVGFVGYPNIGKSSVINSLRNKVVCKVAPVPGETRVWQYITLTRNIYLIDCPGVVPIPNYEQAVLHGAVRVENIKDPESYVEILIRKAGEAIRKVYNLNYTNADDLLDKLGKKFGKLKKGGDPNVDIVSKMVLHDWIRGKIPYYVPPIEEDRQTTEASKSV